MTDTANPPERPLVTFALFAYNQEKYIREAVEGAFSQTYEPLEIILSDDCSSDRTFEIMQEMAAEYKGPHRIILNHNAINHGTALHASVVANKACGDLIIVAAGDDISLPERTAMVVDAWVKHGKPAGVIHSRMYTFRTSPLEATEIPLRYLPEVEINIEMFALEWRMPAFSPACAYTREIFTSFPPLLGGSVIEDMPLMVRGMIIGKFIPVDHPLILQRKLPSSAGQGFSVKRPHQWNRYVHSHVTSLATIVRDISLAERVDEHIKIKIIKRARKKISLWGKMYISPESRQSSRMAAYIFFRFMVSAGIYPRLRDRMYIAYHFAEMQDMWINRIARKIIKTTGLTSIKKQEIQK